MLVIKPTYLIQSSLPLPFFIDVLFWLYCQDFVYDIISSHPFFKTENPQRMILPFALWQYFNTYCCTSDCHSSFENQAHDSSLHVKTRSSQQDHCLYIFDRGVVVASKDKSIVDSHAIFCNTLNLNNGRMYPLPPASFIFSLLMAISCMSLSSSSLKSMMMMPVGSGSDSIETTMMLCWVVSWKNGTTRKYKKWHSSCFWRCAPHM